MSTYRQLQFIDYYFSDRLVWLRHPSDMPIRLLRESIAKELKEDKVNILLYDKDSTEMKDSDSLDQFQLKIGRYMRSNGSDLDVFEIRTIIRGEESKLEFVDFESNESLIKLAVDPRSTFKEVKLILNENLNLQGKPISLYYGDHEMKDEALVGASVLRKDYKVRTFIDRGITELGDEGTLNDPQEKLSKVFCGRCSAVVKPLNRVA